ACSAHCPRLRRASQSEMSELLLRKRQRTRSVDLQLFRRVAQTLLTELLGLKRFELGVHLVAAPEISRINRNFLNHEGSTYVITFDYSHAAKTSRVPLKSGAHSRNSRDISTAPHGEIFICLDEAVRQARQFRTNWQSELVRYLVHAMLHLRG